MDHIEHTSKLHEWSGEQSSVFRFWCPGCNEGHSFTVMKNGYKTDWGSTGWAFDGNYESPTFTPSLLYPDKQLRCHLILTAGVINYCSDCGHHLAGQQVPMVDLEGI